MILGFFIGLAFGYYKGRKLSDDRADRVMYLFSFALAGFAAGIFLTFLIEILT